MNACQRKEVSMFDLRRISLFLASLLLAAAASAQQWTYSINGNLYNTSGNVGIGNPAPVQRLSVGGNIEVADVAANAPELAQNGVDWSGSNIGTSWATSFYSTTGGSVTFTTSIPSSQNGFSGRYQRVELTTVTGTVIAKLYQSLTFQLNHSYRIAFRYRSSTTLQLVLGDNEGGMILPANTGNAALVSVITSPVIFSRPTVDFYATGGGLTPPQGSWFEVDDVSVKEATAGNALVRGMVGIGTGAPVDPLHIEAASNANIRLVHSDPASAVNSIYFYEGSALYGFINQRGSAHATQPKQFNIGNNDANGAFSLWAGSNERMRIQSNGNIGIGSAAGTGATSLLANTTSNILDSIGIGINPSAITWRTNAAGYAAAVRNDVSSGSWGNGMLVSTAIADSNTYALSVDSGSGAGLANRFAVRADGQVIIGGQPPGALATDKLVVNGTIRGSNVVATYQDVAEWVPATEEMAPGTVVVVERGAQNTVTPSAHAYDTRVAGVVSAQPGLTLGVPGASKAMIATTGRVKVRVDASHGPIEAGDLLVTGDKPGVAMRSEPVDLAGTKMHRPGTLIGKALEPLAGGEGEILVLLSLQ
jgi:hypothetical protein